MLIPIDRERPGAEVEGHQEAFGFGRLLLALGFLGPARRDPRRLAGHLGVDRRPRRVDEARRPVALVERQDRVERLGVAGIAAHGSPRSAHPGGHRGDGQLVGHDRVSSSSHPNGVDTCAPGRARTDHAPKMVLWGAFWLKSTKTRGPAPPSTTPP